MEPDTMTYDITVTDTFAGELNYCWVRRYELEAPADISTRALVRRAKALAGIAGRHRLDDYGDSLSIWPRGACVALLVTVRP